MASKKVPPAQPVHPLETLREYATALEAEMTIVLAKPRKSAVHKIRALARRLEAQVELLTQLAASPLGSDDAEQLHRRLRRLRRAAGRVRDLDVQREMLETHKSLPRRAALQLRDELKEVREAKAKKLQSVLTKQLPRIAGAIEQMVQSVGTANGLVVPDLRLIPLIERWTHSQGESGPTEQLDDEQLHTLRKTAKTARYMVENVTGSSKARRAEAHYEEQQNAGGQWHDWLDLTETAGKYFGKKHPLARAAERRARLARGKYVKLLRKGAEAER